MTDPAPDIKIPAIRKVVDEKDRAAIPTLVRDLSNGDPAIRFYSIHALQELTGETMGYNYYDSDDARLPAVNRWKAWLKEQGLETRS